MVHAQIAHDLFDAVVAEGSHSRSCSMQRLVGGTSKTTRCRRFLPSRHSMVASASLRSQAPQLKRHTKVRAPPVGSNVGEPKCRRLIRRVVFQTPCALFMEDSDCRAGCATPSDHAADVDAPDTSPAIASLKRCPPRQPVATGTRAFSKITDRSAARPAHLRSLPEREPGRVALDHSVECAGTV